MEIGPVVVYPTCLICARSYGVELNEDIIIRASATWEGKQVGICQACKKAILAFRVIVPSGEKE